MFQIGEAVGEIWRIGGEKWGSRCGQFENCKFWRTYSVHIF